jgi:acetylornithine deacetylase/succinyl-diaminopimelate desuccinylase-like protein
VAGLVAEIAAMPATEGTSVNAGRIGGGEGINVRAREAWFDLDLRSDDPDTLATLERDVETILARVGEPLHAERAVLGDRPAGRLDPTHPLVCAAADALREAGIEVRAVATSTDANAAHARGIPAIAIGITTGGGEHTPQEWIDIAPIGNGVRALARTVARFEELSV